MTGALYNQDRLDIDYLFEIYCTNKVDIQLVACMACVR